MSEAPSPACQRVADARGPSGGPSVPRAPSASPPPPTVECPAPAPLVNPLQPPAGDTQEDHTHSHPGPPHPQPQKAPKPPRARHLKPPKPSTPPSESRGQVPNTRGRSHQPRGGTASRRDYITTIWHHVAGPSAQRSGWRRSEEALGACHTQVVVFCRGGGGGHYRARYLHAGDIIRRGGGCSGPTPASQHASCMEEPRGDQCLSGLTIGAVAVWAGGQTLCAELGRAGEARS